MSPATPAATSATAATNASSPSAAATSAAPRHAGRLDDLLTDLAGAGFTAVEVEEEFVVHDDTPSLDDGWIDEAR